MSAPVIPVPVQNTTQIFVPEASGRASGVEPVKVEEVKDTPKLENTFNRMYLLTSNLLPDDFIPVAGEIGLTAQQDNLKAIAAIDAYIITLFQGQNLQVHASHIDILKEAYKQRLDSYSSYNSSGAARKNCIEYDLKSFNGDPSGLTEDAMISQIAKEFYEIVLRVHCYNLYCILVLLNQLEKTKDKAKGVVLPDPIGGVLFMNPLFNAYDATFPAPDGTHDAEPRGDMAGSEIKQQRGNGSPKGGWKALEKIMPMGNNQKDNLLLAIRSSSVSPTVEQSDDICIEIGKRWKSLTALAGHRLLEPTNFERLICNIVMPERVVLSSSDFLANSGNRYKIVEVKDSTDGVEKTRENVRKVYGFDSLNNNFAISDCSGPRPSELHSLIGSSNIVPGIDDVEEEEEDDTGEEQEGGGPKPKKKSQSEKRKAKRGRVGTITSGLLDSSSDKSQILFETLKKVIPPTTDFKDYVTFLLPHTRWPFEIKVKTNPAAGQIFHIMQRIVINFSETIPIYQLRFEAWCTEGAISASQVMPTKFLSASKFFKLEDKSPGVNEIIRYILAYVAGTGVKDLEKKYAQQMYSEKGAIDIFEKKAKKSKIFLDKFLNALDDVLSQIPTNLKQYLGNITLLKMAVLFRHKTQGDNVRLADTAYLNELLWYSQNKIGIAIEGTCDGFSGYKAMAANNNPIILCGANKWGTTYQMYSSFTLDPADAERAALLQKQVVYVEKTQKLKSTLEKLRIDFYKFKTFKLDEIAATVFVNMQGIFIEKGEEYLERVVFDQIDELNRIIIKNQDILNKIPDKEKNRQNTSGPNYYIDNSNIAIREITQIVEASLSIIGLGLLMNTFVQNWLAYCEQFIDMWTPKIDELIDEIDENRLDEAGVKVENNNPTVNKCISLIPSTEEMDRIKAFYDVCDKTMPKWSDPDKLAELTTGLLTLKLKGGFSISETKLKKLFDKGLPSLLCQEKDTTVSYASLTKYRDSLVSLENMFDSLNPGIIPVPIGPLPQINMVFSSGILNSIAEEQFILWVKQNGSMKIDATAIQLLNTILNPSVSESDAKDEDSADASESGNRIITDEEEQEMAEAAPAPAPATSTTSAITSSASTSSASSATTSATTKNAPQKIPVKTSKTSKLNKVLSAVKAVSSFKFLRSAKKILISGLGATQGGGVQRGGNSFQNILSRVETLASVQTDTQDIDINGYLPKDLSIYLPTLFPDNFEDNASTVVEIEEDSYGSEEMDEDTKEEPGSSDQETSGNMDEGEDTEGKEPGPIDQETSGEMNEGEYIEVEQPVADKTPRQFKDEFEAALKTLQDEEPTKMEYGVEGWESYVDDTVPNEVLTSCLGDIQYSLDSLLVAMDSAGELEPATEDQIEGKETNPNAMVEGINKLNEGLVENGINAINEYLKALKHEDGHLKQNIEHLEGFLEVGTDKHDMDEDIDTADTAESGASMESNSSYGVAGLFKEKNSGPMDEDIDTAESDGPLETDNKNEKYALVGLMLKFKSLGGVNLDERTTIRLCDTFDGFLLQTSSKPSTEATEVSMSGDSPEVSMTEQQPLAGMVERFHKVIQRKIDILFSTLIGEGNTLFGKLFKEKIPELFFKQSEKYGDFILRNRVIEFVVQDNYGIDIDFDKLYGKDEESVGYRNILELLSVCALLYNDDLLRSAVTELYFYDAGTAVQYLPPIDSSARPSTVGVSDSQQDLDAMPVQGTPKSESLRNFYAPYYTKLGKETKLAPQDFPIPVKEYTLPYLLLSLFNQGQKTPLVASAKVDELFQFAADCEKSVLRPLVEYFWRDCCSETVKASIIDSVKFTLIMRGRNIDEKNILELLSSNLYCYLFGTCKTATAHNGIIMDDVPGAIIELGLHQYTKPKNPELSYSVHELQSIVQQFMSLTQYKTLIEPVNSARESVNKNLKQQRQLELQLDNAESSLEDVLQDGEIVMEDTVPPELSRNQYDLEALKFEELELRKTLEQAITGEKKTRQGWIDWVTEYNISQEAVNLPGRPETSSEFMTTFMDDVVGGVVANYKHFSKKQREELGIFDLRKVKLSKRATGNPVAAEAAEKGAEIQERAKIIKNLDETPRTLMEFYNIVLYLVALENIENINVAKVSLLSEKLGSYLSEPQELFDDINSGLELNEPGVSFYGFFISLFLSLPKEKKEEKKEEEVEEMSSDAEEEEVEQMGSDEDEDDEDEEEPVEEVGFTEKRKKALVATINSLIADYYANRDAKRELRRMVQENEEVMRAIEGIIKDEEKQKEEGEVVESNTLFQMTIDDNNRVEYVKFLKSLLPQKLKSVRAPSPPSVPDSPRYSSDDGDDGDDGNDGDDDDDNNIDDDDNDSGSDDGDSGNSGRKRDKPVGDGSGSDGDGSDSDDDDDVEPKRKKPKGPKGNVITVGPPPPPPPPPPSGAVYKPNPKRPGDKLPNSKKKRQRPKGGSKRTRKNKKH